MLETPDERERLQQLLDRSAWLDQADAIGARIAAEKMFTLGAAG
jgi:hypothetical protein